jgi:hypothetical protein
VNSRSRNGAERLAALLEQYRDFSAAELDVKSSGVSVNVTLRLADEGLESKLGAMLAGWSRVTSPKALIASATPEAKPKAPEPPPPPARKTVLIFGLSNGTREHSLAPRE